MTAHQSVKRCVHHFGVPCVDWSICLSLCFCNFWPKHLGFLFLSPLMCCFSIKIRMIQRNAILSVICKFDNNSDHTVGMRCDFRRHNPPPPRPSYFVPLGWNVVRTVHPSLNQSIIQLYMSGYTPHFFLCDFPLLEINGIASPGGHRSSDLADRIQPCVIMTDCLICRIPLLY